jgi:hypothetical protein
MLGRVVELYSRITEQHSPKTVTFLLPDKEKEYGLTPDDSRTEQERRNRLGSRYLAGIGSSQDDLEQGLISILGSHFLEIVPPSDPNFSDLVDNFPTTPPSYANYQDSTRAGKWLLANHDWGSNAGALSATLICGETPVVGEEYVFGSHLETIVQKCTLTSVVATSDPKVFLLNFDGVTKPVEKGQGFTSSSYPIWSTGRRRFLIGIAEEATRNQNEITDTHNYLERSVRAVTCWSFATDQLFGFRIGGVGATDPGLLGFTLIQ